MTTTSSDPSQPIAEEAIPKDNIGWYARIASIFLYGRSRLINEDDCIEVKFTHPFSKCLVPRPYLEKKYRTITTTMQMPLLAKELTNLINFPVDTRELRERPPGRASCSADVSHSSGYDFGQCLKIL
ncbi:conserved hypothetical protein [Ricinus communis]|uniref:Uncharacterized protein n=1 Tax=Ricinus communis TaxID=3988 RepID=B9RPQ3_RICCO|nr:conserved hypothetical protein [Ricinus communis]